MGRAVADLLRMSGIIEEQEILKESVVLSGRVPVSEMKDYPLEVSSYTKGLGKITCLLSGYSECHNTDEILSESRYDADHDIENTADSIFCIRGAGRMISWDESDEYMYADMKTVRKVAGILKNRRSNSN